jgi:hypothetical protein
MESARDVTQDEIVSEQGETEMQRMGGATSTATDDETLREGSSSDRGDTSTDTSTTTEERSSSTTTDPRSEAQANGERPSLFGEDESRPFWDRWQQIQVRFVDEPRASVEQADALVVEVTQRLTSMFDRERTNLEGQWSRGEDVGTEDLRVALQRYRSFFERLLNA